MVFRILLLFVWASLHLSTVAYSTAELHSNHNASIIELSSESEIEDSTVDTNNLQFSAIQPTGAFATDFLQFLHNTSRDLGFYRPSPWKEKRSSGLSPPVN